MDHQEIYSLFTTTPPENCYCQLEQSSNKNKIQQPMMIVPDKHFQQAQKSQEQLSPGKLLESSPLIHNRSNIHSTINIQLQKHTPRRTH
jgi:hypothetical protein